MTRALVTDSLDRVVKLQEVKGRLGQIKLLDALAAVTKLASRQRWFPESDAVAARVNLINLSHLAKAVVLYCPDEGRPMSLANDDSGELRWLLKAINSMKWYSDAEFNSDVDETIISFLMRQAYVRNFVGDHPVSVIARAFAMFHEILPRVNAGRVDVDAAMMATAGVNCSDLWTLCSAVYMFYFLECVKEDGPWVFAPDFFADSPIRSQLEAALRRALSKIARDPAEIRALYAGKKYHDPGLPEEYWPSEFNVLRDHPVVRIGPDRFCCPYPVFAWMRGAVGFYFDLVTYYADIERATNRKNKNPFDNVMGRVLGDAFQEYVGTHLRSLSMAKEQFRPEYKYQVGKDELDTPDWLLLRVPGLPVLFECKARRPALPLQVRCNQSDREGEIKSVISRALGQLTVFLGNAVAGKVPDFTLSGDWRVIYALVLYDPFPFHALPDTRQLIDRLAAEIDPDWKSFRERVLFVPLSIQELELAVQVENETGRLVEHQLEEYARYRDKAPRMVSGSNPPIFARHFLDYALEKWPPKNPVGRVCLEYWDRFTDFMYRSLYQEGLADHERLSRERWIREAAYFRWWNGDRQDGHDLDHWLAAEREYGERERALGMPPYQHSRLREHHEITRRFK